jgi:hypothetical protein
MEISVAFTLGFLIEGLSGGRLVGTDLIECTGVVP